MYRPTDKTWTLAELQDLFTDYFQNKLSETEIERLAQDCAVALSKRSRMSASTAANTGSALKLGTRQ